MIRRQFSFLLIPTIVLMGMTIFTPQAKATEVIPACFDALFDFATSSRADIPDPRTNNLSVGQMLLSETAATQNFGEFLDTSKNWWDSVESMQNDRGENLLRIGKRWGYFKDAAPGEGNWHVKIVARIDACKITDASGVTSVMVVDFDFSSRIVVKDYKRTALIGHVL